MEELTTIIQETTNIQEHVQQVFKESIVSSTLEGFYKAFLILWPYLLAAIVFALVTDIIKKQIRKRKK